MAAVRTPSSTTAPSPLPQVCKNDDVDDDDDHDDDGDDGDDGDDDYRCTHDDYRCTRMKLHRQVSSTMPLFTALWCW